MLIPLSAKTFLANVSYQFRDQFIIKTILVTNLETKYNFLKLFIYQKNLIYKLVLNWSF